MCWAALSGCRCCCFGRVVLPLFLPVLFYLCRCGLMCGVAPSPILSSLFLSFPSYPIPSSPPLRLHPPTLVTLLPRSRTPTRLQRCVGREEEWKRRRIGFQTGRSCVPCGERSPPTTHPPADIHGPNNTKQSKQSKQPKQNKENQSKPSRAKQSSAEQRSPPKASKAKQGKPKQRKPEPNPGKSSKPKQTQAEQSNPKPKQTEQTNRAEQSRKQPKQTQANQAKQSQPQTPPHPTKQPTNQSKQTEQEGGGKRGEKEKKG